MTVLFLRPTFANLPALQDLIPNNAVIKSTWPRIIFQDNFHTSNKMSCGLAQPWPLSSISCKDDSQHIFNSIA